MKRLIAEFEEQSFIQVIFPHKKTDWLEYLDEVQNTFINIINAIIKYQKCLVICENIKAVKELFSKNSNLHFVEYESDDTWARDCSAISIIDANEIKLLNFTFNAWGEKFDYKKDDLLTSYLKKHYKAQMQTIDFVLEGGAIESNGDELILTTSACMLNKNRNPKLSKNEITQKLKKEFGANEILYLNHGYLAGDDTDSHIDTLARFVDARTIMYVKCEDANDEHFVELKKMEDELKEFASRLKLNLIALPMTDAIYENKKRLPATYANFLFINGAVLVPTYGVEQDTDALEIFKNTFKNREIIGIDCSTLIKQRGSLHCVTMNFASGIHLN
ncbi:agmatine deiminase family protein [Sulfurimonas sp.]|uniref:agmatine deiminase family protein n=1 Tax=Sulfurimonas sp. TaxID=2022749 RepID=UPI002AB02874|nr:agmatine deiminase family protein [Sulfurimonas sp.]